MVLSFVKKVIKLCVKKIFKKSNFDINNLEIIFRRLWRKSYYKLRMKKIQVENYSAC